MKVVATVAKGTLDEMTAQRGTLIWKFGGPKAVAQAVTPAPRAAAMASDARAAAAQSSVYDASQYTGRKVDFNVKDIDIKNLLGAIAEISKKNIIVADDVKRHRHHQAAQRPLGPGARHHPQVQGPGPRGHRQHHPRRAHETLRDGAEGGRRGRTRTARRPSAQGPPHPGELRQGRGAHRPAQGRAHRARHGLASTAAPTRSSSRTCRRRCSRAEGIVRNLDTQTPAGADRGAHRRSGDQLRPRAPASSGAATSAWRRPSATRPASSSPTSSRSPARRTTRRRRPPACSGVAAPNFAVNMPAPIGTNNGGGLGFVFGSAGGAANLNLRLSAAENSGTIKTISSPRVVTRRQRRREHQPGRQHPVLADQRGRREHLFIEARLELARHAARDAGRLDPDEDQRHQQPAEPAAHRLQRPALHQPRARRDTEVLVQDGDTTVIGGIYTRRNSEAWNEVPVLCEDPDPRLALQEEGGHRRPHRAAGLHHAAHRQPLAVRRRRRSPAATRASSRRPRR